jgi:hypothetical protein
MKDKKESKKKKATRKKLSTKRKVTRALRGTAPAPEGAPLSFDLDMTANPPKFINLPGGRSTDNLTIDLDYESREVTINLFGATFRQNKPIHVHPVNGDLTLYATPGGCSPTQTSITFHANARPKKNEYKKLRDKYTLYFADRPKLDPDIQNPGGGTHN